MDSNTQKPTALDGLAAEALLEEYRALRAEIVQRGQLQTLIFAAGLALAAALIPLGATYFQDSASATALCAAPLPFATITWLYFEQDILISQAARYLNQDLRTAISERVPTDHREPLMQWETKRAKSASRPFERVKYPLRLVAVLWPGAVALAVAVVAVQSESVTTQWWDDLLLLVDFAAVLGLVSLSRYVEKSYASICEAFNRGRQHVD